MTFPVTAIDVAVTLEDPPLLFIALLLLESSTIPHVAVTLAPPFTLNALAAVGSMA